MRKSHIGDQDRDKKENKKRNLSHLMDEIKKPLFEKEFGTYFANIGKSEFSLRTTFIIVLLFLCQSQIYGTAVDSLRLASIEGHPFVIYKVEKGDTYFSISKEYGFENDELDRFNPGAKEKIRIGQELKVPFTLNGPYVHKVIAGESLFSLYRIYGVTVEELKNINGLESDEISIGQEIIIFPIRDEKEEGDSLEIKKVHTVQKGETLFSISRLYGIKWQDLKNLNNLANNEISEGQILLVSIDSALIYTPPKTDTIPGNGIHVVEKGESLYSIGRKYGLQPGEIMAINGLGSNEISVGQELRLMVQDTTKNLALPAPVTTTPDEYLKGEKSIEEVMVGSVKKIIERGLCEVIEGGEETYKYLGLHKTLPRGTIVQVTNAENKASVFVRIIGILPAIDQNRNVVLKVSPRAFEALASVNKRFRVEIAYFPELE